MRFPEYEGTAIMELELPVAALAALQGRRVRFGGRLYLILADPPVDTELPGVVAVPLMPLLGKRGPKVHTTE